MEEMIKKAQSLFEPLERVNNISATEFETRFGLPQKPAVLEGMSDKWAARKYWTLDSLDSKYGDNLVKVTRSSDESETMMSLNSYIHYIRTTDDAHPYYLKDWVFSDDFPSMRNDYEVLPHFENWLDNLPQDLDPKFRWLYIGPKYSYSKLHLDILLTNAWNIIFEGRKLWLFFPPNGDVTMENTQFDQGFPEYRFPNVVGAEGYYAIQEPGEIMFTPGSWYHQVYNLEHTVALTENYVNHMNLDIVMQHLEETGNDSLMYLLNQLKSNLQYSA
ncbi:MAG: cupin-like domain-containing protein [Bacteroidota bacterium]